MIRPCLYCDSLVPAAPGLSLALGPCLENTGPLAGRARLPDPRGLRPGWPPPDPAPPGSSTGSGSFQPHPGSGLLRAKGFVWFPPQVPPSPFSCHFERKSRAHRLSKTNKLTNTLKSQSLGQKSKLNQTTP